MPRNPLDELAAKASARKTANGNFINPYQVFGEDYQVVGEPTPLKEIPIVNPKTGEVISRRAIVCACVIGRDGITVTGRPFHTKEIRAYIAGPDGKPSKAYVVFKMNPDSPLPEKSWIDLNSLVETKLMHLGEIAEGHYADGKVGRQPNDEIINACFPEDDADKPEPAATEA